MREACYGNHIEHIKKMELLFGMIALFTIALLRTSNTSLPSFHVRRKMKTS